MPPKAMVVDDSSFQRTVVSEAIGDYVEIVETTENGQKAVEMFAEAKPDIMTMDIMMPEMNGIEALSKIKSQSPETKIVMVTSVSQKENARSSEAGADGYVTKPFEAEDLTAEITQSLDENLWPDRC